MPPQAFTNQNYTPSVAPQDLISAALQEIAAFDPNEPLSAQDSSWGLEKLQRIIDQLNAKRQCIYSTNFVLSTLIANHAPHLIGPTGDLGFQVPQRPARIVSCSFILSAGSANPVDIPVRIQDHDWWAALPIKNLSTSVVTDLYYEPDAPNGQLNFYPVCNVAAPVRLEYWVGLAQAIKLQQGIIFPQGYWEFIVTRLAIALAPSYERQPSPLLIAAHQEAIRTITDNNDGPPKIRLDAGMPNSANPTRPNFDFLTGLDDNP